MSDEHVHGPRADYFCERDTCVGESSPEKPWRDLPIKKPKCPACGASRWMRRLYSGYSPKISVGGDRQKFKIADDRAEGAMLAFDAMKDQRLATEAHARAAESVVPGINMRVRGVPSNPQSIAAELGGFGGRVGSVPGGGAVPVPLSGAAERTIAGAKKILNYGKRRSILDPNPQETAQAVGM